MAALVLLFGNTEYIQEMIGGRKHYRIYLHIRGDQRSLRNDLLHGTYRRGGHSPIQGASDPGFPDAGRTAGENTSVKTTIYYKKKDSGIKYDFSY